MPKPANTDTPHLSASEWQNQRILEWLARLARLGLSRAAPEFRTNTGPTHQSPDTAPDDWQTVSQLCGHSLNDFIKAEVPLPLTSAEIDHFRRNHRGADSCVSHDFLTASTDLPSPLAELYGLYLHRTRVDTEATLFVAQATGSTRVARVVADLLAIGGFANGLEHISFVGATYSVPAAFDTSDLIDRANQEAARRISLPVDHPNHLLRMTPDEIGVLATHIAEKHALDAVNFLEKARLLAEARQDVNRLPVDVHFTTAITEHDLPLNHTWVMRLCAAYMRIFERWTGQVPEIKTAFQ